MIANCPLADAAVAGWKNELAASACDPSAKVQLEQGLHADHAVLAASMADAGDSNLPRGPIVIEPAVLRKQANSECTVRRELPDVLKMQFIW
jgi:hypothetical protein